MKRFQQIIFVLFLTSCFVYAQDALFNIQMQKIQNSPNWNMDLELNIGPDPGSGFVVELPAGVFAVLSSVRIGETDFWLKESSEPVTIDSVIHWERTDSTLVLRFNTEGSLPSGLLSVRCTAQVAERAGANPLFTVKRMAGNNPDSAETMATTNVNIAQ